MKKLLRFVALALVSVFLLLHTGLHIGRDMAVQWLLDQGATRAGIHSLTINWLSGSLMMQGVVIETPEQPMVKLNYLALTLDYPALFNQRVLIRDIQLQGTALHLRQVNEAEQTQFYLGPVLLPASGSDDAEPESAPSEWAFGVRNVSIDDFSFEALLPDQRHHLTLKQGYLDALYTWQQMAFTQIQLDGAINGADFNLDTRAQPLPETKRSELTVRLDKLPLHSITGPFVPGLEAVISVDLTLQAEAGEQISIEQRGSIIVDKLRYQQQDLELRQQRLAWQGTAKAQLLAGDKQQFRLNGTLQSGALALQQQDTEVSLSDLNWQGGVTLSGVNQGIEQIDHDGKLTLAGLVLQQPALQLTQQALAWQGDLQVQLGEQGLQHLTAQGGLTGADTALQLPERLQTRLGALDWQGALAVESTGQGVSIQGDGGTLALQALQVQTADQRSVVSSESLKLDNIGLALPETVSVAQIAGQGIQVAADPQQDTLAQLDIDLQQLQLQLGEHLNIARVAVTDLVLKETLTKAQQPQNSERLLAALNSMTDSSGADSAAKDQPVETEADTGQPMRISIAELTVNGDSTISFRDESTAPAFSTDLKLQQIRISGLDTVSQTPAEFSLALLLDRFTQLQMSGATNLAAGGEDARWEANLEQLELPRISPYSIRHTGYYLNSGQLYLTSSGELQQGQIDGTNNIRLNRLEVEPADQDQVAKFGKQLSMPLGTAISILQDGDDNIELDVPISGSLDDPDFGLQSVVKLLAGKGLKQAAFSFLTKSLQPYGTLISLASGALMDGAFVTLQPVSFSAGQAGLNSEGLDYLGKISSMMMDRKGMRLNICGQAVQQDQQLIAEQLLQENAEREEPLEEAALAALQQERLVALAQQRGDAIKAVLLETVPGERLFSCFPVPRLDDPAAQPEALLAL